MEILEENRILINENQELTDCNTALRKENDEFTENMQRAMLEAQKILEDMDMEQEEQQIQIDQNKIELRKQELESGTSKAVEREVAAHVGQVKSQAVVSKGLFESETYVKVPRKLWKQILQAYEWGIKQSKMVDKLTEQNALLMEKLEGLKAFKKKAIEFLGIQGLTEEFREFLHPKKESIKDNLKRVGQKSRQRTEMNESAVSERKRNLDVL